MKISSRTLILVIFISVCPLRVFPQKDESAQVLRLQNGKLDFELHLASQKIVSATMSIQPSWAKKLGVQPVSLTTDAGFGMEIMWTDWQAPKMAGNAENPVTFTQDDFSVNHAEYHDLDQGKKELKIFLTGNDNPLAARLTYQLDSSKFYIRTRLEIIDSSDAGHFLQKVWPVRTVTRENIRLIHHGGFGQPVAFQIGTGGVFMGIEYPAADNLASGDTAGTRITCGHEIGEKISSTGFTSEWVVEGMTPDTLVKLWFMKYVNDIRVAPLRPYTLYNSWYDLRSAEYPRLAPENVMNESNIERIVDLLRTNMIDKHHITLDAFVLDDGWDVYQSDWVLRRNEFPHGLKPIAEDLKKTNTALGLWLGPTGGYSFRMKRINWMRENGYEVVGSNPNTTMLCLAGKKYSDLVRKRVTDFVSNDEVGYFKWDGIQFSCSELNHGHPPGIFSRRAVMESVIDKCKAVREKNPDVYLNVTSGTWLSPWWVKYANQIWMQGEDYGYADVPSISPRDAAMTYRDLSLYDDFRKNDLWFPIQNLMTHGIIKGSLEKLGGDTEPLDKFTNEVLLYLARGVSMWELYISPDILTEGEWNAIGQGIRWAKDRFPILSTTEMVGGDPKLRESYGYVHFSQNRGIIAARNPWIIPDTLKVELSPADGLDPDASSLVLERVYPTHWISPKLYRAGMNIHLVLDGYETAIYELYPASEARKPLLTNAEYDLLDVEKNIYHMIVYPSGQPAGTITSGISASVAVNGQMIIAADLPAALGHTLPEEPVSGVSFTGDPAGCRIALTLPASVQNAQLAILATPQNDSDRQNVPQVSLVIDGKDDTVQYERGEGASVWCLHRLTPGSHSVHVSLSSMKRQQPWHGSLSCWTVVRQQRKGIDVIFTGDQGFVEKPMPPLPFPAGVMAKNIRLGEVKIVK